MAELSFLDIMYRLFGVVTLLWLVVIIFQRIGEFEKEDFEKRDN